jgi:tetratricopeptide (TPR) repeat protein/DNA-binding CsgD family transcriptional regulator
MKYSGFRFLILVVNLFLLLPAALCAQANTGLANYIRNIQTATTDTAKVTALLKASEFTEKTDLRQAIDYAWKATELAETSNAYDYITKSLMALGALYFTQGMIDLALEQYLKVLNLQKEAGDKNGTTYTMTNIGSVYLETKNYDKALSYLHQAEENFRKLPLTSEKKDYNKELIRIYNNLGIIYMEKGNYKLAISYYEKGLEIGRKVKNEQKEYAKILNNLGNLYIHDKQPEKAFPYLKQALEIRMALADKSSQAQSYRNLAAYYSAIGKTALSLSYLYQSYNLAVEVGNVSLCNSLALKLFDTYNETGKSDSALKYHLLYKEYADKINVEKTKNEIIKFELVSEYKEKEALKQAESKRRELKYILVSGILLMTLIIFILLFFLSNNRNKRLKLLQENIVLESKNIDLQRNALQQELELKNKELTTQVMYKIRNNEFIQEIISKMKQNQLFDQKPYNSVFVEIIRDLDKTLNRSAWSEFELRFNQVHSEFYEKLFAIYPDLSPNERKLCAFLRLNMTTKDIASITGQTVRSIEVARTRLRKKLNLTNSDEGLIKFLSSL